MLVEVVKETGCISNSCKNSWGQLTHDQFLLVNSCLHHVLRHTNTQGKHLRDNLFLRLNPVSIFTSCKKYLLKKKNHPQTPVMQSQSLYGISLNFWKWLKPDSTEQAFQIHLWLLSKHVDVKDEYPPRKCNYAIICHSTLNQVKEAQLHQPLKASCWIQQGKAMSSLPTNHKLWSIPLFKRKKVKWTFQKSVMHVLALKLTFLYRVRVKIASFPSPPKASHHGQKAAFVCALLTCGCHMVSFFNSFIIHPICTWPHL